MIYGNRCDAKSEEAYANYHLCNGWNPSAAMPCF